MSNSTTLTINKDYIYRIYSDIKSALGRLEVLLADVGCLHLNKFDVTTMDGTNLRRYICPDCAETIEEEIQNVEE